MTTWRVDHDSTTGVPVLARINDDGSETSGLATGSLRPAFDAWNATQQPPLVVATIVIVKPPTPVLDYAQAFVNNLPLWAKLHKKLDEDRATFDWTTATAQTILVNLRTQVQDLVSIINTAPAGVITAFQNERVLQGSTTVTLSAANINAMLAPECRILINVIRSAANQGLAIASTVNSALD